MKKATKPVKASRKLIKRIKQEQAINHEVVQPAVAQTPDDALPAQSVVASLPEQALKEEAVQPAVSTMVDAALDAAAQSVASAPLDLSLSLWAQAGAAAAAVDAGAGAGAAAGAGASTAAGAAATTAAATTAAVATGAALSTTAIVAGVAAVGVAAAAAGGGGSSTLPPVVSTDTTAPVITFTAATDDVGSVTGALTSGATTDDTALVLSGTTEAGATVKVYNGATLLGNATVTGTNWSYSAVVADGTTYQFNAKATDAAGNTSAATTNFTVIGDTTAPLIDTDTGLAAHSATKTIDLTYTEALDATNIPLAASFAVTTGGVANPVASVAVTGSVMTLTLTNAFVAGAVTVSYTDPTAGNDVNAIQDAAGNDASGFASGVIADGYLRGATVYIDTNGDGVADPAVDYLVGTTDASGNFFIKSGAPTGTIIAVGGVNIDTGVANTTALKAPAGSTTINPLTTLVQAVVDASLGTTTAAAAATSVATSLGLTGLGGQSLLNYDPISAGNVGAQKAAAQVATIVALAESSSAGAGSQVIANLATVVNNAGAAPVVLADASTISAILPEAVQADATATSAISDASTSIGNAASISAISTAQSQALDTIAPNAPTLLSVAATTNDTTPAVRVNLNTTATNGTAAVAGDTITLRENGAQAGSPVTLTAADIAAGFKLVDASTLSEGSHTLSAVLTDQAGNISAAATGVVVNIDTQAPGAPVINAVATDDVINSSEQTAVVSGLAEANATVSLSIGGNIRTATANGSGSWSYTLQAADITAMGQGAETLSATATDAAGNTSAAGTRAISVDTAAPTATAPVTSGAAIISDNTPALAGTITGTLGAGEVVAVYDGATRLGLATVSGSAWTFNTPSLSNAVHTFTAKVEDAAGNSGSAGTAYAVTVNATVPTATATITTATDDVAAITGNIASGGISNDSIPVLGGAVVGTLGTDAVVIYDGATRLGAATVTGTSSWSYTPSALSAGAHSFTAVVETNAGNQGTMSTAYGLTLDFTAPNAAVINPVAIDNVVNAAEKGAGIVVTGTAEAGSAVVVTWGAASKPATATGGVWSVTFASGEVPADNVSSTISATVTDTAGNAGVAATRTVLIDSAGPSATITTVAGDNAINAAEATTGVTVTGTTEANAKVALSVGAGNIRSLTADGTGAWSYQLTAADIKAMGQGSETLSVTATDAAGNSGTAATQGITIDTTAPVLTAFSITDASDSGIKGDGRSNVAAPTITFTAEAGATLAIDSGSGVYVAAGTGTGSVQTLTKPSPFVTDGTYVINLKATDGAGNITVRTASYNYDSSGPSAPTISGIADNVGSIQGNLANNARTDDTQLVISGTAEAYSTVTVYNGVAALGIAAANASGNWTYTTPTLTNATAYVFSAKATDAAGNQGAASVTSTVTIDTTPPVAPAVALATDSGSSAGDGITNVGTVNVTGLESGASWQYSTNGGTSFNPGTGTSFTLDAGTYAANAVQVKQTDIAGNAGVVGVNAAALKIDTTAPAAPAFALATDSGTSASDGITNVGTVNVTALESGASWQYSTDGGTNFSNGTGTSFSLTAATYATGAIKVRQIDVAGNTGAVISNTAALVVDQTAPTATAAVTGADDNVAPTTGNLNSGDTTNDPTLGLSGTITGALAAGDVVSVYDGATRLGLASVAVNGSAWTFTTATLGNAAHNFTARVEDAAGNQGSAGTPYVVTVNASVPTATATITGAADDVVGITGNVATGGTSNDSTPTLSGAVVGTLASGEVVAIYDGATKLGNATVSAAAWSYTPTALSGGAHSFTAVVESSVGNQGTVSTAYAVTLDLTAPAQPAGTLASDTGASAGDGITNVGTINVTGLEVGATWQYSTNSGTTFTTGTGTSFTLAAGTYAVNALQVKQTDAAGNTGSVVTNTGAITVDATAPVAPAVTLGTDSGSGASDGITNVGTINVTGLESGASWQYSTNGGTSFSAGTGTSFTLTAGTYAANAVQVKQTDVAGNTGVVGGNAAAITVDTTAPAAPGIALATDSGASSSDGITNLGTVNVTSLESGASWQYSTNAGTTFTTGTGTSFTLAAGTYAAGAIQVKQTDLAGNAGTVGSIVGAVTVDATAPATLAAALASDTGASSSDGVTNVGTINVTGIEPGATWQYSTNSGSAFSAGTGTSFTLPAGTYVANAVQIKQTDVAGNVSTVYANGATLTVDATAPAAPGIALASDTGASTSDGVTNVGTVNVTLEANASWQYSINGGTTFSNGTGTSFTLGAGSYSAGSIQVKQTDLAGNTGSVASIAAATTVDLTAPTPTSVVVNGSTLTLTFNEALDSVHTPSASTLSVLVNGVARSITNAAFSGTTATITLASAVSVGETVTLSYTDPTAADDVKALQDLAGNDISSATNVAVTNNSSSDVTAPTIVSAVAQDTTLTLTYSEALDATHQPSTSYFQVAASTGAARSIEAMQISGSTVVLTLSKPLLPSGSGTTYTLKYTDPSAGNDVYAIQDLAGNDAASYATQAVTVSAAVVADTTAPTIAGVAITPGTANAVVTLQFSEAVAFTNATGLTLTSSAGASIPFTLASGTTSDQLVLTTTSTLAATDSVVVGYNSATGSIKDLAATPNNLASATIYVGGDGVNTITAASSTSGVVIRANSGDDTITGSSSNDTIVAGGGADTVDGGNGADTINLNEGTRAVDTVKLLSTNTSWIPGYDTVNAFDVSKAGGTNNDVLNLPSGTIAADAGVTAGTVVNTIAKHSIASGIVSFYDASGVTVAINTSLLKADALNYLSANLTQAGRTVGFALDSDGNGQSDSLMVFQDGVAVNGYGNSDIAVQLAGVNGVTLSNTAGQNVVQIADTTAATSVVRSFATGANSVLTQTQSEDVSATGTGTAATILVNGAGTDVVTARNASGNTITFTTSATLAQTDWLLFTSGSNTADGAGNAGNAGNLALVGGSGANVINGTGVNVSGVTGTSTVNISAYGGNDQITGTAAADVIWGGAGADTVSGGLGADQFRFIQGDSTAVTVAVGGDATLNTGDIFTFTSRAADVVHGSFDVAGTSAAGGDRIQLFSLANQSNPTGVTAPTNGLVTDQKFFTVQGNYDGVSSFTVNTTSGLDTLVVYDGDATSGVTQTALVVQGHTPTTLTVSGNTLYANVADTDVTAPTLTTATVNGAVLTLTFSETIDPVHTPITFPDVLVGGVARALVDGAVNGNVVTLTLGTAVISSDVVTFSYTDPTSGNDANALQDLAGNDVASGAAIPVTNQTAVVVPLTLSASLLDNVTNLEVSSNIVLNFSANVTAGASKYIHVVNDGGTGFHGESTVNTLDILVTDTSQVTIAGGKVTINPTADLDLANNYHISIDAGAFTASASGAAMAAYDGITMLNFSTVTPGTSALANAAASRVMNADGTLGSGHLWLDIEGFSNTFSPSPTPLELSAGDYALAAKDYFTTAASGSVPDGIKTGDFNVAANNFGSGDIVYIDNQGGAANDLSQLYFNAGAIPPTTIAFANQGASGAPQSAIDITLAGSGATFGDLNAFKLALGIATAPVISA